MKFLHIFEALFYGTLVLGLTSDSYQPSDYSLSNSVISQSIAPYEEMIPSWATEAWEDVTVKLANEQNIENTESEPLIPENAEVEVEDYYVMVDPEEEKVESGRFRYGDPVPLSTAVGDEYFANTAIIGDSRSQGLMSFGAMPASGNYTGVALSVYTVWEKKYVSSPQGDLTLFQALQGKNYDRFYIGLGINCVGYPSRDKFVSLYGEMIDEIRSLNPNAEIYLQSIIPVNEPIIYSRGTASYINNEVIQEFNQLISQLAGDKQCHYLDLFTFFVDETGQLPESASSDGLHFGSEYSKKWTEYLRTHTATFD